MLDKLSLNAKFLILSISMALITILISTYAYDRFQKVSESNDQVTEVALPNLMLINSLALQYRDIRIHLRTLGLPGLDKKQAEEAINETLQDIESYEKNRKIYKETPSLPGEEELFNELDKNWIEFKAIGIKALELYKSNKPEDYNALVAIFLKDCPEAAAKYNKSLDALLLFHKNSFNKFKTASNNLTKSTNHNIILITIMGLLFSIIITVLFAFNAVKLSKKINEIAYSLKSSSDEVSIVANQISHSSEGLSQASVEQAASLQETSSSIEEISAMISSNTQSAVVSAKESEQSLFHAERGKKVVEEMIGAISKINTSNNHIMDQINTSNQEIEEIIKLISEIGSKTKVINDIVFQTKLLSFNASVEAARAGENGKGFAVVAEEVGNLAAMSGSASIEISSMLEKSIQRVESIIQNSKEKIGRLVVEGKMNVDNGTRVAHECGVVLDGIVKSVATVSNSLAEISTASQEQSQGVREVTKAVSQLDQVTQENSNTAAESAKAAGVLTQQSDTLAKLVANLVNTIEGKANDDT